MEDGLGPKGPPLGLSPLSAGSRRPNSSGSDPTKNQEARSKAAAAYAAHKQELQARQQVVIRPVPATATHPSASIKDSVKTSNQVALPTLEQLASAPRFGLNARELILQAAAQVTQPQHAQASKAGKPVKPGSASALKAAHGSGTPPPSRLNPSKLCDAIAPADRPFVQYVPRSNIPRLSRQSSSDSLLGKYLALLLEAAGYTDEAKAVQVVKSEAAVRKVASSAAAAHEASLYKKVTSKVAYTDAAGKTSVTRQTLIQFADAAALEAFLALSSLTRAAFESSDTASGRDAGKAGRGTASGAQQSSRGQGAMQDLFGCESEGSEEMNDEECDLFGSPVRHEQHVEVQQQGCSDSTQGLAVQAGDSEDVNAAQGTSSGVAGAEQGQGLGSTAIGDGQHTVLAGSVTVADGHDAADNAALVLVEQPAQVGEDAEGQPPLKKPKPANATPSGAPSQQEQPQQETAQQQQAEGQAGGEAGVGEAVQSEARASAGTSSHGGYTGVAAQVAEFVRGVLDPLYRAQLLSKQQYKEIVRKAVAKIMDHHQGATSATFLLKEHESVRRYVMKLVEGLTSKA